MAEETVTPGEVTERRIIGPGQIEAFGANHLSWQGAVNHGDRILEIEPQSLELPEVL